jgi:MYND finger
MDARPCAICAYPATKKCSGYRKVHYCSKEHQSKAWQKHKHLCKIYQMDNPPDPSTYCGLCSKTGPLIRTECCDRPVCDDEHLYVPFTFGRVSCARNHSRYTVCHNHMVEHPQEMCHWQDCRKCRNEMGLEAYVGQGTSNCNFPEDYWEDVPAFAPSRCTKCGMIVKINGGGYSTGRKGIDCTDCTTRLLGPQRPGQVVHRFQEG